MTRECEVGFRGKVYSEGSWKELTVTAIGSEVRLSGYGSPCPCDVCIEGEDLYLIPGAIDVHVHVRDWDLAYKETIESATKAALKGGVVAIADMPNTLPEISTEEAVIKRIEDFKERSYVDFAIYSGLPQTEGELRKVLKLPILGIKVYPKDYGRAKLLKGSRELVVVHPEDPAYVKESPVPGDRAFSRNPYAEISAIKKFSALPRVHFTHVTLPESVELIRKLGASFDSTPHHLLLTSEDERHLGCLAKVNPPLREPRAVEELREKFRESPWTLATDHAPHSEAEKRSDFLACPPGIASLEVALPLITSTFSIEIAVKAYSELPARLIGAWPRLGAIRNGSLASFTILKKEAGIVNPRTFESKAKFSPFEGYQLKYSVYATVVRGSLRYFSGAFMKREALNIREAL